MSIQDLIDAAQPGDRVVVPDGVYEIDAVNAPLRLKSDITLDLGAAVLQALPTAESTYQIVRVHGCNNVTIIRGTIKGERDSHLGPTNWKVGGWGHGISIREGSRNIKVLGTNVSACFADGLYIEDAFGVEISKVVSDRNRRQGLSVIQADGVVIDSCQFSNNGGTPPGCGIDLECDTDKQSIRNVQITRCVFFKNEGSCIAAGSPGTYSNLRVTPDNHFDMTSQPIWAAGGAAPLGTSWYAMILNRIFGTTSGYRWWGYPQSWYHA